MDGRPRQKPAYRVCRSFLRSVDGIRQRARLESEGHPEMDVGVQITGAPPPTCRLMDMALGYEPRMLGVQVPPGRPFSHHWSSGMTLPS